MISYCKKTGLILNNEKTQLLVSTKKHFEVNIGSCVIKAKQEISILGVDYDKYFTTNPYLVNLAREAKTRAALIKRLSFGMPPHLLSLFANGLLMGKILAAALATIPISLTQKTKVQASSLKISTKPLNLLPGRSLKPNSVTKFALKSLYRKPNLSV